MKKNSLILSAPVILLLVLLAFGYNLSPTESKTTLPKQTVVQVNYKTPGAKVEEEKWVRMSSTSAAAGKAADINSIIAYALSLEGSPYLYTGITPDGFDCSGFVTHVFDTYYIDVPHSSALQAAEGIPVAKQEAASGDIVIFTGTDETVREPGHVGIVISAPGDTISFVHSSSNGGVKISKVQGTRYDVRFLEVRRVL